MNHKFTLRFFLLGAGLLIFSNQISPHEENISGVSRVYDGFICSSKSSVLKIYNRLCSPQDGFQTRNDKIIVGWKAIHHNRADQNPHQRWPDLQRKPALHHPSDRGRNQLFSRASGTAALDAIPTHSAEFGFCLGFEHDLTRVCHF